MEIKNENDICIYNFVSSPENPLTWRTFSDTLMQHCIHRPTVKTMWYPTLIIQTSMISHKLTVLILHYLPAFLLDLALITSGKKLRSVIGRSFLAVRSFAFTPSNVAAGFAGWLTNTKKSKRS